ncbi:MAG: hypothetical protein U0586_11195 [Candidatus Brocadiaceae bacterium]
MGKHLKETEFAGKGLFSRVCQMQHILGFLQLEFVLTLDADSILDSEYTIRLVHVPVEPGNERIGVVNSLYGNTECGTLERCSWRNYGYAVYYPSGFTAARATFWVGANALIQREALDDIVVEDEEKGFRVFRYIQDRTVMRRHRIKRGSD